MIFLAYDGSLHCDWIARYAMVMAINLGWKEFHILNVQDGKMSKSKLDEKLQVLIGEIEGHALEAYAKILPLKESVYNTVLDELPNDPSSILVMGTRSYGQIRGFLTGSISEDLLIKNQRTSSVAFRVAKPGLLGLARNIYIPVAKRKQHFQQAFPILKGILPTAKELRLFHIHYMNNLFFRYLSPQKIEKLKAKSQNYIDQVLEEMKDTFNVDKCHFEARSQVSNSLTKEIILDAHKWKADLLFMGAPDNFLGRRFFFGSLFEQILRKSNCDVALYRMNGK